MPGRDFYETLGVARDASADEIRKSYRKLARKHHPDVNPGDSAAAEAFKDISQAYKILGDEEARRRYDRGGIAEPSATVAGSAGEVTFGGFDFGQRGGAPFSSIFSDLFGGRGAAGVDDAPGRGDNLQVPIRIDFGAAFRGFETTLSVPRQVTCTDCSGRGVRGDDTTGACPACGGAGQQERRAGFMRFSVPCEACGGSGQRRGAPCSPCSGTGAQLQRERIRVRMPPGVDTGSQVRVGGKGHAGRHGGPAGDLFLLVEVEPHPFFRRKGENLFCEIPITFAEAALGTRLEVPTLDGPATIRVPPGTQPGQKIRLRGRGFPALRSGGRGDLFVEVRVVTPKIRDERSKEILRELARLNPDDPRADIKERASSGKG